MKKTSSTEEENTHLQLFPEDKRGRVGREIRAKLGQFAISRKHPSDEKKTRPCFRRRIPHNSDGSKEEKGGGTDGVGKKRGERKAVLRNPTVHGDPHSGDVTFKKKRGEAFTYSRSPRKRPVSQLNRFTGKKRLPLSCKQVTIKLRGGLLVHQGKAEVRTKKGSHLHRKGGDHHLRTKVAAPSSKKQNVLTVYPCAPRAKSERFTVSGSAFHCTSQREKAPPESGEGEGRFVLAKTRSSTAWKGPSCSDRRKSGGSRLWVGPTSTTGCSQREASSLREKGEEKEGGSCYSEPRQTARTNPGPIRPKEDPIPKRGSKRDDMNRREPTHFILAPARRRGSRRWGGEKRGEREHQIEVPAVRIFLFATNRRWEGPIEATAGKELPNLLCRKGCTEKPCALSYALPILLPALGEKICTKQKKVVSALEGGKSNRNKGKKAVVFDIYNQLRPLGFAASRDPEDRHRRLDGKKRGSH